MKIVRGGEKRPAVVASANLVPGRMYRSASVSFENAMIFLSVEGDKIIELSTNQIRHSTFLTRYVEVEGTLNLTGDKID